MQTARENRILKIFDEVARGASLEHVLNLIADQVAADLGAPTCKIWVVKRGDMCERCPLAGACASREMCMHLVAASGAAIEKEYPRVPLALFNASVIARGGASDFNENGDLGEKLFGLQHGVPSEGRDSYALHPLRGGAGTVGLIGVFNHRLIEAHELGALARLAPAAVAAIRVAELQSRSESLRLHLAHEKEATEAARRAGRDRETELEDAVAQLTRQVAALQVERDALRRSRQEDDQRIQELEDEIRALGEHGEEEMVKQQEYRQTVAELTGQLEADRRRVAAENDTLRGRVTALELELKDLAGRRDTLMGQVAERDLALAGLRAELDGRQLDLVAARAALPRLEERVAMLEEANAGLREHNAALVEGLDDLEHSLRIAEDARARLEQYRLTLDGRLAEAGAEAARARAERDRLITDNQRLRGEAARLLEERGGLAAQGDELAAARARAAELEMENARLAGAVAESHARAEALEAAAARHREEVEAAERAHRQKLDDARARAKELFRTSRREQEEKLALAVARADQLEQEKAVLAAAHAQAEAALGEVEALVRRLGDDALRLRDRVEAGERERAELERRAPLPANLAHELRTPMNAIIGFMALLLDDASLQLGDRHRRSLERILHNARDLLAFVNNVLDLAKIDAGRMDVYAEDADLRDLVERAVAVVEPLREGRPVHLAVNLEDGLPALRTDRTKLQQILINLLSNAVKFTPAGEVLVAAARAGDGHVRLAVSDTGVGIAESDLPKIFEEFRQVGAPARGSRAGTGLGLAITRRLVELLGGEINVTSHPGMGSTFAVTLPLAIAGRVTSEPEDMPELADPDRTALVIDGDPASLYVIKKYLTEAGYSTAVSDDAGRGVKLARLARPAVITVNVDAPEGGLDLIRQILEEYSEGRVIAVSTDGAAGPRALEAGARAFLTKPIERAALLRAVERDAADPARVLVVDDDPDALDLVVAMMEGSGYEAHTATNGRAALDEVARERPAVIILDLMLPEMDGFEVVHRLSLNPEWQDIPVILVTALDLSHEERRALDLRAGRILQKGNLSRDALLAEVKQAINAPANGAAAS